ncbi:MAG: B12-binding domain-containing protein [Actinomycetota bacterium]
MATEELSIDAAAELLGVHYMTAYRYVRTGVLEGRKQGAKWIIDPASVRELQDRSSTTKRGRPAGPTTRAAHRDRLIACLVKGDDVGGWQTIEATMAAGATPEQVYLDVLAPAMAEIGARWEQGTASVADEHRATAVAYRLLGLLGARHRRRGRRRGAVVIGAVHGDHHALATAILADLWRGRGYEVIDLGAHTPVDAFVSTAATTDRLLAVGLSASTPDTDDTVRETFSGLREAGVEAPLLLGGRGIPSEEHARSLGADHYAATGEAAIELLERLDDVPG